MKIVYNNSDFELPFVLLDAQKLPISPSSIDSSINITVFTTSSTNGLSYTEADIVEDSKLYIDSSLASTLDVGVIYYKYEYEVYNENYSDNTQNITNIIQTNYYLSSNRQDTGVIPTSTSELINDADFATKTWVTSSAYTKAQVNTIANHKQNALTAGTGISIVNNVISSTLNNKGFIAISGTSLPSSNIQSNTVYLLRTYPDSSVEVSSATDPIYDEYIYENNNWVHIGKFELDAAILDSFDTRLEDLENQNVFLTEDAYEALELAGEVDADKIYYTYES